MAFPTKDGKKKFGSAYVQKRYDENHAGDAEKDAAEPKVASKNPFAGAKPPQFPVKPTMSAEHENNETPEFEKGEQEGAKEVTVPGVAEGKEVAQKHGPAHTVTIKSDPATGRHTVVSHHNDGHSHQAQLPSAEDAHATGKALAGVEGPPPEQAQAGDESQEPSDNFQMPSLG